MAKNPSYEGILGAGRIPGPIGLAPSIVGDLDTTPRNVPTDGVAGQSGSSERVRVALVEIRREMRKLWKEFPPPQHGAVFHSGSNEDELTAFKQFLARRHSTTTFFTLEETEAAKYLVAQRPVILRLLYSDVTSPDEEDWNRRRLFRLRNNAEFAPDYMGFWRELSARFAQRVTGTVHVLLSSDRARLPERGSTFWHYRRQGASGKDFRQLGVFGFVEYPILSGDLSKNGGVTKILHYQRRGTDFREVRRLSPGQIF
jgi:hypothetical protein